jgi:choline dehydrogenase-like flavoprotein
MSSEDLPRADSRITRDKDGTIHMSLPADNNVEGLKRMRRKFDSMLADLGFHEKSHQRGVYLHEGMNIAATAHQAGTARFGTDPATSVLDVNCKAHELDNLYVVDSSFFVSIGAVNPTLTIIANALRVGDHLLSRLA